MYPKFSNNASGIRPREMIAHVCKEMCSRMLIKAINNFINNQKVTYVRGKKSYSITNVNKYTKIIIIFLLFKIEKLMSTEIRCIKTF